MSRTIHCDLAIIGGGAGGLSLAAGSAQLGLKVVLVESGKMGGDCLNYGCVPSKSLLAAAKAFYHINQASRFGIHTQGVSLNFSQVMHYVHQIIANIAQHDSVERFTALGVQVIQSSAKFISPTTLQVSDQIITAKRFAIATGSSPSIPPIPGIDSVPFLTNETIFSLQELPEHLVIIGGGPIGCELAQAFAMLGSKVSIIEVLHILPGDDADCVEIIRQQFKQMDITIYEQTKVQQLAVQADQRISITFNEQQPATIAGTHLLIATGRNANVKNLDLQKANVKYSAKGIEVNRRLQTSNKKIYALGDVVGPYKFTHTAGYQAGIVLRNIVFKWPAKVNYQAVPWVTYTEPELAHVGLLAIEAEKRADVQIIEWPFMDNDRAQTEGTLSGKIKIITDNKAKILGVTIVGPHAGELILPWVMVVNEQKTLRSFTDIIIPYPTLSEISKRAAGTFYAPKLFSDKIRWLVRWLQKLG